MESLNRKTSLYVLENSVCCAMYTDRAVVSGVKKTNIQTGNNLYLYSMMNVDDHIYHFQMDVVPSFSLLCVW